MKHHYAPAYNPRMGLPSRIARALPLLAALQALGGGCTAPSTYLLEDTGLTAADASDAPSPLDTSDVTVVDAPDARGMDALDVVAPDLGLDAVTDEAALDRPEAAVEVGQDASVDTGRDTGPEAAVDGSDAGDVGVDAGSCPVGETWCASGCANLLRDSSNCGACGLACPTRDHATATCNSGNCALTCQQFFANCDGAATNGCEVDLIASQSHCGACRNVCTAGRTCTFGRCARAFSG